MLSVKRYNIPDDFKTLEIVSKDDSRTFIRFWVIAILLFMIWKRVGFFVGMEIRDGELSIACGDARAWNVIRKYLGVGSLDSF